MKCPKCGSYVPEENTFCTSCGYRVRTQQPREKKQQREREAEELPRRPRQRAAGGVNWQSVIIGVLITAVLMLGLYAILGGRSGRSGQAPATIAQPTQQTNTDTSSPTPEPTPTPTPESAAYLLPTSSTEYLSESDISGLTWEQLCLARNEIFARHGRMFNTPQIKAYFEAKDWYQPSIPADRFDNNSLSAVEKANVQLISQYESSHYGGSYY